MAQKIYTVLGVVSADGSTLVPAAVLAGDCTHLLCDSGYPGAWGHVVKGARDHHKAVQQAIDEYELYASGEMAGEVHVEVVSTPDRRVGRWGRRRAQRRLNGGGSGPLQIV
jgi:hypothetical protein